ncbi:MAG: hypothetical protein CL916_10235, partial [Deltaproteobacteria bacterium]|nr:hypothetical protein [Deltaproteobacteria bacterium]
MNFFVWFFFRQNHDEDYQTKCEHSKVEKNECHKRGITMSTSIADFLSGTGYFSSWPSQDLMDFATHFQQYNLEEGELLFKEGDEDTAWYIIMSGRMSIIRDGQVGSSHILAELERGEAFGEMSLLEKRPRMGSAMAMEPSIILKLDRIIFEALLDDHHPIAVGMLKEMAISQSRRRA